MDLSHAFLGRARPRRAQFRRVSGARWLPAAEHFSSINPANEQVLGWAGRCTREQYDRVLSNAVAAFSRWRMVPAPRRGELVRLIVEALRRHKSALGSLIALETGKIKEEGDGEVQEMIDIGELAVGQSRMLYGRTMQSERSQHRMYEQWHPLGVVGVITAFNFPAAVWAWNAFIAAVCGDVVVWRPRRRPRSPPWRFSTSSTRRCCRPVHHGIFSLTAGDGSDQARWLVDDQRVPLISFTGSSRVGREVARAVAGRMGRCLLECSGNNAVIVDETRRSRPRAAGRSCSARSAPPASAAPPRAD